MSLTLADLIKPATAAEYQAKILAIGTAIGLNTTSWQSGGITRTIIAILSNVLASADTVVSTMANGGFLDLAASVTPDPSVARSDGTYPTGPGWLDLCALYVYDVTRTGATYGSASMVLTNALATPAGPFAPGTYHIANPSPGGGTYHNVASLTIGGSGNTTATFEADVVGAGPNIACSSVTQTVTSVVGVSIVSGSQSGSFNGKNAQSNAELIGTCRDKLQTLAPQLGLTGSYRYLATKALDDPNFFAITGVDPALVTPITRVLVQGTAGTNVVNIYLANASGAPSTGDLAAIDAYLQALAVPVSVGATSHKASTTTVTLALNVWIPVALQNSATTLALQNAYQNYINSLPIGGITDDTGSGVPFDAVIAALFAATIPVGGTTPAATQITITLNGATANVALAATAVAIIGVAPTPTYH